MQSLRVLVTGAGSMVGQGIIKSLHHSTLPLTIVAADISPFHAGLYRTDEAVIIPRVETLDALDTIIKLLNQERIDVVLIGSEYDLEFFALHKEYIEQNTKTLIVASNISTVRMANDKWHTVQFLKKLNLLYPESYLAENIDEAIAAAKNLEYPFILKPRIGTSARNVHIIRNEEELISVFPSVISPIIQKMISPPSGVLDNEYTCSLFKTKEGELIGPFNSRRVLKNGSSWVTEVNAFEFLNPLLMTIGNNLDFMGSINVQLMNSEDGPMPFEFNARSSGTTAIRSYYGFNEPEMTILNYCLGKKLDVPVIKYGYCLRYVEELFLPPDFMNDNPLKAKAEKLSWF